MPRISPKDYARAIRYGFISLFTPHDFSSGRIKACASNVHMVQLVSVTGSYQLALQELRWIKNQLPKSRWQSAVLDRTIKRLPLQYILGDQPFLSLDIKCDSRALIPRWETELWVSHLISNLNEKFTYSTIDLYKQDFTLVDACTGTGCIGLAMVAELKISSSISTGKSGKVLKSNNDHFSDLNIIGLDVDSECISLAKENLERNESIIKKRDEISRNINFWKFDLLKEKYFPKVNEMNRSVGKIDLLVSNPPYITCKDYEDNIAFDKSVKLHEPKIALVGDLEFYNALINNFLIWNREDTDLTADAFVFEVGYPHQILYVANRLLEIKVSKNKETDIWRVGQWIDENCRPRCVIGWKRGTKFECLEDMVHSMLVK